MSSSQIIIAEMIYYAGMQNNRVLRSYSNSAFSIMSIEQTVIYESRLLSWKQSVLVPIPQSNCKKKKEQKDRGYDKGSDFIGLQ